MLQKDLSNLERSIKHGCPSHESLISKPEKETFVVFQAWRRISTIF